MKKILCLLLCLLIILPVMAFADITGEVGYSESDRNVYIAGDLSKAGIIGSGDVTLLISDKTSGDIKYVEQLQVANDGKYEIKFKFEEDLANCELSVKEGANNVNSSVNVAYAEMPAVYSLVLRDENESHFIEPEEFIKATATISNKYGNGGKYKIIAAFFDENNGLLECQTVADGTVAFDEINKKLSGISTIKVPEDAVQVKAFMWNDTQTIIPLSENQIRNVCDKKFGGDTEQITVAFFGDSITYQAHYLKGIEHYYHTRYPDKDIVFVNKGITGNHISNLINRFSWDVTEDEISGKIHEAVMMFGMNDINRGIYGNDATGSQATKDSAIQNCVNNAEKVIKLCREEGISLTIITPSAFDDTEGFNSNTANLPGANTYGLCNLTAKLKVLAEEYNIPVIDLWTPTTDITNYVREEYGYTGSVIAGGDRVHPGEQGGTYMAYQFVKQQDGNPIIASVEINAVNGSKAVENADVNVTSATNTRVEYEYLPKAIPFARTVHYQKFEDDWNVSITEDINQEIIKVTGLEEGNYKITIGTSRLSDTYSAQELANGVNIAIDDNNPAQAQAKIAYEKAVEKVRNEGTYRSIATTEQQIKANPGIDISKFSNPPTTEELQMLGPWPSAFGNYFSIDSSNYGSKKYEVENWAKLRIQEQEARNAAKPVQRTVVIEK